MTPSSIPIKPSHNEELKDAIPTLAGTIAATLADAGADHFSEDDNQFLKFHGCYQQDDRDLRKTGKKYIMMVRSRIPGGVMTAEAMAGVRRRSPRPTATTRCASPRARPSSFTAS